jgi:hypothetical protein
MDVADWLLWEVFLPKEDWYLRGMSFSPVPALLETQERIYLQTCIAQVKRWNLEHAPGRYYSSSQGYPVGIVADLMTIEAQPTSINHPWSCNRKVSRLLCHNHHYYQHGWPPTQEIGSP